MQFTHTKKQHKPTTYLGNQLLEIRFYLIDLFYSIIIFLLLTKCLLLISCITFFLSISFIIGYSKLNLNKNNAAHINWNRILPFHPFHIVKNIRRVNLYIIKFIILSKP